MVRFSQTVPVLQVADVGRSVRWFADVFGFAATTFPEAPPYSFAILTRGATEIMLQCNTEMKAAAPVKHKGLSVYIRLEGGELLSFVEEMRKHTPILRGPERMFYQMVEVDVDDLDGHRIVVGEELGPDVNVPMAEE